MFLIMVKIEFKNEGYGRQKRRKKEEERR